MILTKFKNNKIFIDVNKEYLIDLDDDLNIAFEVMKFNRKINELMVINKNCK